MLRFSLLLLVACGEPPPPAPPAPRTVVVVSLDTTRADAIGAWSAESHWRLEFPANSRPTPETPVIDGLVANGVRFAWALSSAPTTLNSHTTIFSGRDPHRHRVVRNGYPVPADVPLLTERFQQAGWDTLAVVGSSALEHAMGLDRGFRAYDDPGPQPAGGMLLRKGEEVTSRALAALDARTPAAGVDDLFLFVHYYDAHTPWFSAPAGLVSHFTSPGYSGPVDGSMASVNEIGLRRIKGTLAYSDARQARALYLAQVAYMDQQVGKLLDGLKMRGRANDMLVVLLADHGETLDEDDHNPYSHGPDVDLWDLHVPLVMAGTGSMALPKGVVVQPMVRLLDVASTVSAQAGLGGVFGDGQDLSPLWRGGQLPEAPLMAEATKPQARESQTAWNNLPFERAVATDGRLLLVDPASRIASLHRLAPAQPLLDDPDAARPMVSLIQQWDASAPPHRVVQMSEQTRAALIALGYLDPTAAPPAAQDPSALLPPGAPP